MKICCKKTEFKAAFTGDWIHLEKVRNCTDKPCVHTGPGRSGRDRICCLVPNGSTYEDDPNPGGELNLDQMGMCH